MSTLVRTAGRVLLGLTMVAAGLLHLTSHRHEFQALVPGWFPLGEDLTVVGSGFIEITLGTAFVAMPRHQRFLGAALAVFLVAVFPGNLGQYVERVDAFGLDTDRQRLGRLFFQPLLVLWALWAGGWFSRRVSPTDGRGGP